MSHYDEKEKRTLFFFIATFFLLAMGIAAGGYVSYSNFERDFRHQAEHQISAIAELKVNELLSWRNERLSDGEFLYRNSAFSALVERYFTNPADVEAQTQLFAWLDRYEVYDQYDGVRLLDIAGDVRLSVPITSDTLDAHLIAAAIASLQSGNVTFFDFYRDPSAGGEIRLAILVPIFTEQGNKRPLGVLMLIINPDKYLYPYIQSWPANSTSAETLLVRRDGNEVLFLNELLFKSDAALNLHYPLIDEQLPAVKAASGQTGIVEGVDYRGKSVLADIRPIPDSPWFLISKIDTAEVYSPVRTRLWQTFGMIVMAILAAGAVLATMWRQQRIYFYRTQAEAAVALHESDERFKSAFQYSAIGMALISPQGKWLKVNSKVCAIVGYSDDELLAKTFQDITHPEDLDADLDQVHKMLAGEIESYSMEKRYFHKDGHIVWVLLAVSLVKGSDGAPLYFISQIEDITERKQAEESLRASEAQLSLIFNSTSDMQVLFRVEPDDRFILQALNRSYKEMLSLVFPNASADIIGRDRSDYLGKLGFSPEMIEFEMPMYRAAVEKCDITRYENVFPAVIGNIILDVAILPVLDQNGKCSHVIWSAHNVTERRQAEDALRESEQRYRTLVSNAPVVSFVTDEKGIFTLSEGKGLAKLGLQPGQVVGLSVFDVYRDYPAIMDAMTNALAGHSQRAEVKVQDIVFDIFYSPVFDEHGNIEKVIGVANDITERNQAENKVHQLNLELEQRVRERTLQLEITNKELEAFSYSVSHDLRAPLRGIDGWSQALLEDYAGRLDERGQQYIDRVRSETQRMGHLIDDMLHLSRLTRAEMLKEHVDLNAIAHVIIERLKLDEPHRQVDFNIQAGLTAEGDSHLLEAVLANLLGNAFKFTGKRADALIEFGQTELQGQRVFFVRDNGAGFDMAYAQKLFGAFQRMHKVSEFPGTGVGLATVQRIIHRHGGRVWAEAEVGLGATFYFTLA